MSKWIPIEEGLPTNWKNLDIEFYDPGYGTFKKPAPVATMLAWSTFWDLMENVTLYRIFDEAKPRDMQKVEKTFKEPTKNPIKRKKGKRNVKRKIQG